MSHQATAHSIPAIGVQFWRLTKPRVVSLIVFTAVIGMLLAAPGLPPPGSSSSRRSESRSWRAPRRRSIASSSRRSTP